MQVRQERTPNPPEDWHQVSPTIPKASYADGICHLILKSGETQEPYVWVWLELWIILIHYWLMGCALVWGLWGVCENDLFLIHLSFLLNFYIYVLSFIFILLDTNNVYTRRFILSQRPGIECT